ncbi:MAG: YeeE/YedE family protein [Chloroflexi bacterium]|nr:YeeE/YedE family protein [Chloroflexota bacterium]
MAPFPLPLEQILGHWGSYVIYLVIGFAFGYVLEIAGFGNSTKLAAQFYFKEMTVLKVMFTAIIVAMVLVFGAAAVGLLDYNLIYVNPTYLWPGIVGGLLMGVGFIVGGFCPGTSLVSAATGKIDGIFFVLGVFFGIFLFGETVSLFEGFWNSSFMGRFTLMDWLGLPTGVIVVGIVLMALVMFFGAELAEKYIGGMDLKKAPRWRFGAAGGLLMVGVVVLLIGQPTTADRWARIEREQGTALENREVQIHPGELLDYIHNDSVRVIMLDVRAEVDYNLFHIHTAQHVADVHALIPSLHLEPENTLFVVMSNGETAATEAWKVLVAEAVPNAYILEGGINHWIEVYGEGAFPAVGNPGDDALAYNFDAALGARHPAAEPLPENFNVVYTPRVEFEFKRGPASGGCG